MKIGYLELLLNHAWCAETAQGEWRKEVPSINQDDVTSLVVQDYFGGDLLRCKTTDIGYHYWNRLTDGTEVDLTEEQFNFIEAKLIKEDNVVRHRDYVLSFQGTLYRYHLLKKLVGELTIPASRY